MCPAACPRFTPSFFQMEPHLPHGIAHAVRYTDLRRTQTLRAGAQRE